MFWSMKPLLLNQTVSINRRLRLLDPTVGSCATWCCESWTPKAEELRQLEVARRAMLRKIVGARQGPDENWVDWIQRATRKALVLSNRAGVREWAKLHFEKKWSWAGHAARSSARTWLYRVTMWRDSAWQRLADATGCARELRPSTRRWMKWEDNLRRYCNSHGFEQWTDLAQDRGQWAQLASTFSAWAS